MSDQSPLPFKSVHILGVAGTLMAPFAVFLKKNGVLVTGTDDGIYPPMSDVLSNAQVFTFQGYAPKNLDILAEKLGGAPDFVIVGNVIRATNPEMVAVKEKNWKTISLPEFMEKFLLPHKKNIVITGTHGKTTTSSIMSFILKELECDPSYFIGGVSQDLPQSFYVSPQKNSQYFVLEGDEYDTVYWDKVPKFYHYCPDHAVITSIEFDHADIYKDLEHVKKAFQGLLSKIRKNGHVIACTDYVSVCDILKESNVNYYTYSLHKNSAEGLKSISHFSLSTVTQNKSGTRMEILENGKKTDVLESPLSGEHNALNVLAVYIECKLLGLDLEKVKSILKKFKGVKRRQDLVAEVNGIGILDDFAHHPTAVKHTLRGLKNKYQKRLLTVFEPRSATSRRNVFQKEFAEAFLESDMVFISKPYDQSSIPEQERFSSELLVQEIKKNGKKSFLFQDVQEGLAQVVGEARPGDMIVVLSNGGFGGFIPKCIELLKKK